MINSQYNDIFHRIADEVADTVSQKNHDYGNSYFRLRKEKLEEYLGGGE